MRFHKAFSRYIFAHAATIVLLAVCIFAIFFLKVDVASAISHPGNSTAFEQFGEAVRLSDTSPIIIIARLIRLFLGFLGIIMVILVIYAGWLYMSSLGEPKKIEKAKKLLKNMIIGTFIVLFSFSISWWILNTLLTASQGTSQSPTAQRYAEPLRGSLGAGIINSHYPPNQAVDVARNTRIFVEFKEAILPESIGTFAAGQSSGPLNAANVKIYKTAEGKGSALAANAVTVLVDQSSRIFVFRPSAYLGSSQEDTNYTVELLPGILKANGSAAFTGAYSRGYNWVFQVGTEIDVTPPTVVSTVPADNATEPRNVTVEITFSEAMDPIVSTGTYAQGGQNQFTNIGVKFDPADLDTADLTDDVFVPGTYEISNGYRTVSFTTTDACAQDPCADTIFCLPPDELNRVSITAGTVDPANIPQALLIGALPNGLTDASGNSLDGNADGKACQGIANALGCPEGGQDGYNWNFTTTGQINTTVPHITRLEPDMNEGEISLTDPIKATFSTVMKGSTISSSNASLWPQNYAGAVIDSWWFYPSKSDSVAAANAPSVTTIFLEHPTLVAPEQGAEFYYPVFGRGLKSSYQICMLPAAVANTDCAGVADPVTRNKPFCCGVSQGASGVSSATPCAIPAIGAQPARPLPLRP